MVQLYNQSAAYIWECSGSDSETETEALSSPSPPPQRPASLKKFEFSPPKTLTEAVQNQSRTSSSASDAPEEFAFESPEDIVNAPKKTAATSSRVLRATNRRPWTSTSSESSSKSSGAPKKRGRPAKSSKKPAKAAKSVSTRKKNPVFAEKANAQKRKNGRFVKEASEESSRSPSRASSVEHSQVVEALQLDNDVVVEVDAVKLEAVDYEYEGHKATHDEPRAASQEAQAGEEEAATEAMRPVIINSHLVHTQLHGVIVSNSRVENCTIFGSQIFGPLVMNQ